MYFTISLNKTELGVFQPLLFGEFFDKVAGLFEIMAWKSGKEVMGNLQMESAMEKFHEWVTDHVSRGAELAMRERLGWAEISSRARVMGKDDLGT